MLLDRLDGLADDDLRDARLLAWLLDSTATHGAGLSAVTGLGGLLAERGAPGLAQALASIPPPACNTTVRLRSGEVEVLARVADVEAVIAWRTTPAGYDGALERAMADGALAVGVAPRLGIFPEQSAAMAPVLLWPGLLRAFANLGPAAEHSLVRALLGRLASAG